MVQWKRLKDVEECMKVVETMSSRKFNNEQCDYLVDKLKAVFQSANSYLKESRGKHHLPRSYVDNAQHLGTRSRMDYGQCVEVFKLLVAVAEKIESFVCGCCDDAWIQAAISLTNVSEYVSSLGFDLELCRAAFCKVCAATECLTSDEVGDIYKDEVRSVEVKASADVATLRAKVLEQNSPSGDDGHLAYLRRRIVKNQLDSAIPTIQTTPTTPTKPTKEVLLGRGATAEVFEASWFGMPVAEKIFYGGQNSGFKKEVEILGTLSHPNITSMFCSSTDKRKCSISMELMDGHLQSIMRRLETEDGESSPFLEMVDLMLQLGEGVNYLHNKGIVHMDLKSLNVLVRGLKKDSKTRYFHAKVTDFGISKTKAHSITFSDQPVNLGSNRWMAPEIINLNVGVKETSSKKKKVPRYPKKCDVFSFAMVCYEILTGNVPFPTLCDVNAKKKVKAGGRPVLPEDCPLKLKTLIEKCWNQVPEERPSFKVICSELRHLKYLLMTDIVTDEISTDASSNIDFKSSFDFFPNSECNSGDSSDNVAINCDAPNFTPLEDIATFDIYNYKGGFFTYCNNFLVDRPVAQSLENPYTRMMDRVRHRLEPCAEISTDASSNIDLESSFDYFPNTNCNSGDSSDNVVINCDAPNFTPLEVLVELLIHSDVLIQIALFQLLLEERFAVPIVVPYNEDCNDFRHLLEALNFVHVKVVNQNFLPVAENTSLPRVVFVSNRQTVSQRESADMACEVMNCHFLSKEIRRDIGGGPTIVELGVGFLKSSTTSQPSKHEPCLVFCVSGDHNKLGMTLEKIADVVIIEIDPGTEPSCPSWIRTGAHIETLFWSIDSSKLGYDNVTCHVSGNFKVISKRMPLYVLGKKKFKGNSGDAKSLAACFHSLSPLHRLSPVSNTEAFEEVDFNIVRKSLSLQKLYTKESEHYFLSLRERWRSTELKKEMQICQQARKQCSGDVQKLPILQLFVQLLSEKKDAERSLNIMHLQLVIDRKLRTQLEIASKEVVDAFEKTQNDPRDQNLKESYKHAMNEHVSQMLGLEHLWRELSHIFVADPENQRHLPKLAARHLLDGFPLEILDGDAINFYKEWVDTVLIELDHELQTLLKHKPKVFVLSVVGLQSSGKSTLLNVMFGTKLKTSAGMCTRGVFLQLVKSEWPTFDYVLILDTMGLRAPEYFGREDSAGQDNLLATFAVLPADACIVMVANEEDNGLKEVLPMVMLAFKGSAVAELGGGRIQSKLFFVYTGVDVNDVDKLGKNQRKLKVDLTDAANAVAQLPKASSTVAHIKVHGTNDIHDGGVSLISKFQINCEDEKRSDVKFFGNLKKGTRPPEDTPIWEYGSKVEELREYINDRVLDGGRWSAHELVEWKDYLGMVWQSIAEADFELSFLNHSDHTNYQDLQTQMATSRQTVGRKWQDEFDQVLTTGLEGDGEIDPNIFNSLWSSLKLKVKCEVDNEDKVVESTLELRQFQKWKLAEIERWRNALVADEKHWKDKLRDCIDGTLRFDLLVKGYITRIQLEISERGKIYWENIESPERGKEMEEDFEELFERILADAKKEYQPLAETVKARIQGLYDKSMVGRQFSQVSADNNSVLTISWQNLKSIFGGSRWRSKAAEDCLQLLIPCVQNELQNVKQYSDHLVWGIMELTSNKVKGQSKRVQGDMHAIVKELLVVKLSEVQEEWDLQHNVARKLVTHRGHLRQSFLNHANKVSGTKMLSMALCNLLGPSQLLDGFKAQIARSASNNLQCREEWVCNWKVMRAHLDLHLIELIKANEIKKVIHLVQDGALHYNVVVDKFIKQEINDLLHDTNDWKQFTGSICDAMKVAAVEAMTSNSEPSTSKPLIFLQSIIKSLGKMSQALARGVSITVSKEAGLKYSDDIDFDQIRDDVSASVNSVQLNMTNSIKEVIELVRIRLNDSSTASARARCVVMCPRCKLTCFKAMNHDGKHNTLHQPLGLCGIFVQQSKELCYTSCSKNVQLNLSFCPPGVNPEDLGSYVPYTKWTEIFPEWILPSQELGTVEVREYIFAHFQEELLNSHRVRYRCEIKECTNIPDEFQQHSLSTLQLNLENTIRSF